MFSPVGFSECTLPEVRDNRNAWAKNLLNVVYEFFQLKHVASFNDENGEPIHVLHALNCKDVHTQEKDTPAT